MFRTLNGQFLLYLVPIFVISFAVLAGGYDWISYNRDKDDLTRHLERLSHAHSLILAESMSDNNSVLQPVLAALTQDQYVKGVCVLDTNGKKLGFAGDISVAKNDIEERVSIVQSKDGSNRLLGELVVVISTESIRIESRDRLRFLLALGGVLLMASIAGGVYSNQRGVVQPITRLLEAIRSAGPEARHLPVKWPADNEVGDLIVAYNDMQLRLADHEKELVESRAQFREMFENSAVSVWQQDMFELYESLSELRRLGVVDLGKHLRKNRQLAWDLVTRIRVIHVNEATLLLFGARDAAEFMHRTDVIFRSNTIDAFVEMLTALWNNDSVFSGEAQLRRFDDTPINAIITFPIPRTADGLRSVTVSVVDITDRVHEERATQAAYVAAESESREKSAFLARISHDILVPLNTVMGFTQALRLNAEASLTAPQVGYIDAIMEGGKQIQSLVQTVQDMTTATNDDRAIDIDCVKLNPVLKESITSVSDFGKARRIDIVDQISDGAPVYLLANRQRLGQALVSLFCNAIKYNKDAGRVTISGTVIRSAGDPVDLPDFFRISVTDTGIGIAKSEYQTVFDMFDRGERDLTSARDGLGASLSLTRKFVKQMDGLVGFESEVDVGSEFWIELPLAPENEIASDEFDF